MDTGPPPDPLDPPFLVAAPHAETAPVVFASPHSGDVYPAEVVSRTRLDALSLRRSEDAFIDTLFESAPGLGMPLIKARFPRAYVDANRGPWELDPGMFADRLPPYVDQSSPRAAAGLGTIARIVSDGAEIYRDKLRFAEAKRRIETLYMPYHARLSDLLDDAHARWTRCLLVDCHSMPSGAPPGSSPGGRISCSATAMEAVAWPRSPTSPNAPSEPLAMPSRATILMPAASRPGTMVGQPRVGTPCRSRSIAACT